ncbi:MAG: response regulator [Candidatus Omnitrophica bacterium]|nr:response regulator [Candidatus Omnitrophota bacterium]
MAKILVVDDEEMIRKILVRVLMKAGYEVIQASGGAEAIEVLKSGVHLDMMVTDMKMPTVTGIDVLKAKKDLNDLTPVIILTGVLNEQQDYTELNRLGLGAQDILYKPIDLLLFLDAVKNKLV